MVDGVRPLPHAPAAFDTTLFYFKVALPVLDAWRQHVPPLSR